MAMAAAAPAYLLAEEPHLYHAVPLTSKSTYTQSSQVIDHGSTFYHAPVVHHVPVAQTKTTITKANQVVNHGGSAVLHPVSAVVHTPVVHAPFVHTAVVHMPLVYHSAPLVTLKTGDSAITHQSYTVHETVPVVKSYDSIHN